MPKNYYQERFSALGAPYRQIRRNNEAFSADVVPNIYRGKTMNLLVFSGLGAKYSALYDLGHTKASKATHSALHQFISDHGIPAILITDGDQSENFSKK